MEDEQTERPPSVPEVSVLRNVHYPGANMAPLHLHHREQVPLDSTYQLIIECVAY